MKNENIDTLKDQVLAGLRLARKKRLAFRKDKKTPVVISQNEKIIHLNPKDCKI